MEDKFKNYYLLIDKYDIEKNVSFYAENKTEEETLFKYFFPMNLVMIIRYVDNIINKICEKLIDKEKVLNEIDKIKKLAKSSEKNNSPDYKWKNVVEMIKGDFSYLKEIFILKDEDVPDKQSYINNFRYPNSEYIFPFSIEELYHVLLNRTLDVMISNYYSKKKKKV